MVPRRLGEATNFSRSAAILQTTDMYEEISKTIRLHLAERLTSPLFGAFALSWVAWNYRFVLILLSSEPVRTKFQLIEELAFRSLWPDIVLNGLLFPIATAAFYIFVYPYPARLVYKYSGDRRRDIIKLRQILDNETPLTVEASAKIREESIKESLEARKVIDARNAEIRRLESEIASLIAAKANPVATAEDLDSEQGAVERPNVVDESSASPPSEKTIDKEVNRYIHGLSTNERARLRVLRYGINEMLDDADFIALVLGHLRVTKYATFSGDEPPGERVIAVSESLDDLTRDAAFRLGSMLGFKLGATIHEWESSPQQVLFGAYGDGDIKLTRVLVNS